MKLICHSALVLSPADGVWLVDFKGDMEIPLLMFMPLDALAVMALIDLQSTRMSTAWRTSTLHGNAKFIKRQMSCT